MSPGKVSQRIVVDRLERIDDLLHQIRALPLEDRSAFFADPRNVLAAESCLRRSLEALLDVGRHILAKSFARGVTEYRDIGAALGQCGVLDGADSDLLRTLAGYRNRMVHFYHEVGEDELYAVCSGELGDVERIAIAYRQWMTAHPDRMDTGL